MVTLTLNPAIDKSTIVDRIAPEHKLRCETPKFEAGGGGINVSRAIRKLGGESLAIFPAGGHTGMLLQSLLENEGVHCSSVPVANWTRENFIVVESSSNHQFRFGMPGPRLSESEGQACLDILTSIHPKPDYIVASGSLPLGLPIDFFARIARISKSIGARFILDTSGEPLALAANEGVYLLKPNLGELSKLAGVESIETDGVEKYARSIIARGNCEVVAVSLGPGGAMLVTKEKTMHVPAPTVRKRSTVGAGDSMVAGMVLSLARGRSLEEMIRFGVACGTAATMNVGTELCKRADAEYLYEWITNYGMPKAINY
ncbi:1-phosphofructokinase family hexose kinase [Rhodocytophaga rosea]|uniref:1-phosphofructokinase family hexose kinase n=1 Tax=Rhodocytophaga rosea TaxID=2704465 RepID=A0A6C0GVX2_9BACT|nr:1-phosphofructokinase family hexose kinase [Rhodocytophaga rosea]QHT72146.1 1-phosphofructokinase family hexose kinase [Rhodocytophaga rosea]